MSDSHFWYALSIVYGQLSDAESILSRLDELGDLNDAKISVLESDVAQCFWEIEAATLTAADYVLSASGD